jgi:SAM-dependent methyltransferase
MLGELRRVLPDVDALLGSAEAMPLPDGSVDAVACGQAFHWFDPAVALPELARVLRPHGRLGLAWNRLDVEHELAAELDRLVSVSDGDRDPLEALRRPELFEAIQERTFAFTRELGRDDFVEGIGTSSAVATLPDAERRATLRRVGELHDEAAVNGVVVLPYVTRAYRTTRR